MSISNKNSKLGKIPNISMTPIKSCGNCASCAKDCYALKAYKQYPSTRKSWDSNYKLARNNPSKYFNDIVMYLDKHKPKYFRWHVAGDILNQAYFDNMSDIACRFTDTKFLAFTKMHALDYKGKPKNLSIVFSMFPTMARSRKRMPIAWLQDSTETRIPRTAIECNGQCDQCGICWNLKPYHSVYFNIH